MRRFSAGMRLTKCVLPLERRVEVAAVVQLGERVGDRRVAGVLVQLRVRQSQSDLPGEQGCDLLLLGGEHVRKVAAKPRDDSRDLIPHEHRRGHASEHVGQRHVLRGLGVAAALELVVDDDHPGRDRPPAQALARSDRSADDLLVAARHGPDDVFAAQFVESDERDPVGRDDNAGAGHDLVVDRPRVEGRVEHRAKRGEAIQQRGALGQLLPLMAERQSGGQAVADDLHRREVTFIEEVVAAGLDAEHAEQLSIREQRDADLADDARIGGKKVRITSRIWEERGLSRAHDPAKDPPVGSHHLNGRLVVPVRAELERRAVPHVHRRVAVAERVLEDAHDAVERLGRRAMMCEQAANGLDRLELASVTTVALVGEPQAER